MSNYYVYKVENEITKKCYIGVTSNLKTRIKNHHSNFVGNSGEKLYSMYLETDFANITFEVIDTAGTLSELAKKEKYYIEKYDALKNGYNSDRGGGFKKPIYQFNLSGELISTFEDLESAANAVNAYSSSISHSCIGDTKSCKGFYWSYSSTFEEYYDCRKKSVNQFDLESNLLNTYESISEASKVSGVNKSSIAKCCRGERKKAGNFIWKFS